MAVVFKETQTFVNAKGESFGVEQLRNVQKLGIYFSAHWCPPCRGFTPQLAECYERIRAQHPEFEIVFVSSDRQERVYNEYLAVMPWLAIPYDDPAIPVLKKDFNVTGIPTLVFVDGDGTRITLEGRAIVNGDVAHKFANVWDKLVPGKE